MKFLMVTTFFGRHSFGGDAAFVDRLSRALLRNGHEVDVVYSVDAFRAVRGSHPERTYKPPEGLGIFPIHVAGGFFDALWTHQTGSMGRKVSALRKIWSQKTYDVIHFHNVSLMGAPALFQSAYEETDALRLMTASEHWLICPLSLLWKFNRKVCDKKQCFRCMTAAGRPPQLWRLFSRMQRYIKLYLDALIFPSRHTMELHTGAGISGRMFVLNYFLPDEEPELNIPFQPRIRTGRPYFAAAGRLVKLKGIQNLFGVMEHCPDHDLLIAGAGPFEKSLKETARSLHNVIFVGLLDGAGIERLFRNAVAVIVPSLFYETFGYVALEAFSVGTPAIVNRNGALPELIEASGGGMTYNDPVEIIRHMRTLIENPKLRDRLGKKGLKARQTRYSEKVYLERYFSIIEELRSLR